jgi:DNA-binding NtrC family response regulator
MLPTSARVLIYDSSSLQCELLATGLESLRQGLEIKCVTDLESMITLLTTDPKWVVLISDTSTNGAAISLAGRLRARFRGLSFVLILQEG